jgi:serine/threonine protein kinase
MPWFDGGNLRTWCVDKDDDARLRAAQRVADAVCFLHANHLLHRDIRPENILLSNIFADATPMLCAFARSIDTRDAKSAAVFAGTQLYAAVLDTTPSEAADIFCLGMILADLLFCLGDYNLLQSWCCAGSHGSTVSVHLHQVRADLRCGNASLPGIAERKRRCFGDVTELTFKMLALEATERPTAKEVAERLSQALEERTCCIC